MESENKIHLLKKFFKDQCTDYELMVLTKWINDPDTLNEILPEFNKLMLEYNTLTDDTFDSEKILTQIRQKIRAKKKSFEQIEIHHSVDKKQPSRRKRIQTILKYAAIFLIPLAILTTGYFVYQKLNKNQIVYIKKTVPKGTRTKIVLADGTKVWINANSTLTYPRKMGKKFRKVYLTGEAYFDVTKNKEKPFIVITKDIKVKVLGTAFNVNAYPNNKQIRTTLVRGKVKICVNHESNTRQPIILHPGEQAVYSKKLKNIQIHKVNTTQYTAWTNGELIFNETTLQNVVKQLNQWYNLNISIQDTEVRNYQYTGKFVNKSSDEVIDILEKVTPTLFIKTSTGIIVKFDKTRKDMLYQKKGGNQ